MPFHSPSLRGRRGALVLAGLAACLAGGQAVAQTTPEPGRGQLLYATHCIACHTEQVHWRDRKAASDWPRLKQEVRRWQAAARLGWTEVDIVAVARYLNETIYHLPQTADIVGGTPSDAAQVLAARSGLSAVASAGKASRSGLPAAVWGRLGT